MNIKVLIAAAVVGILIALWIDLRVALPVILLAPYWLGPAAVRLTARYARSSRLTAFRPGVDQAPEQARIHLGSAENTLRGLGFDAVAYLQQQGFAANVSSYMVLLDHPARGVAAMATAVVAQGPATVTKLVTYTELWTRFDSGHSLTTNNSPQPNAFDPVEGRTCERLPGLWDVARLARVHDALVQRLGRRAPRSPLAGRPPAEVVHEAMTRELTAQIDKGLLYESGDDYRPTWKGAALMSWRLLWPMKSVRERRVRRRAEALLAELGV